MLSDVSEMFSQVSNTTLQEDDDAKPSWNILREDFMMGATMKDWDKASNSGSDHENEDPDADNFDSDDDT